MKKSLFNMFPFSRYFAVTAPLKNNNASNTLLRHGLKNTIKFSLALVITGSFLGCNSDDTIIDPEPTGPSFNAVGLDERVVYQLHNIDDKLFAATDKGLYKEAENNDWQLIGEATWVIEDWEIMADGRWIVSTTDADSLLGLPSRHDVYESIDEGQSWHAVKHDFGGNVNPDGVPEPIFSFTQDSGVLFGTGYASLGRSFDSGHSWELLNGFWDGAATGLKALTLSPDSNTLWYGGQGSIENLVLTRYTIDDGVSTFLGNKTIDLLPAPSTAKKILFDPADGQRVFVCAEGGIIQSTDNGETWQAFLSNSDHRFYFDMLADTSQQGRFITAGWEKGIEPQPLVLDVSTDDGQNWTSYTHPDKNIFGGVYSMTSRIENGETVIYLGLFRGGVIKVTDLP